MQGAQVPSVLVVEDDALFADECAQAIKDVGMSAEIVDTGRGALEYLFERQFKKERVDAVVLDLILPDMSGFEMLDIMRYVKDMPRLKKIPVIVVSALQDLLKCRRLDELSVRGRFLKPFKPELIAERIELLTVMRSPIASEIRISL